MLLHYNKLHSCSTFQALIDQVFERRGDAIALRDRGRSVSYSSLLKSVQQVSAAIDAVAGTNYAPVAVLMQGSSEYIITILAVLYSGRTFLPLDPRHSGTRNAEILSSVQCSLTVTGNNISSFQAEGINPVINYSNLVSIAPDEISTHPAKTSSPDDIAYILFTSGSTGKPKGVTISHANLLSFIETVTATFSISGSDRFLFSASVAYAVSIRQIFIPLALGAVIVIAGPEETADPLLLFKLVERERVTFMDMVPSYMRRCPDVFRFSNGEHKTVLSSLRIVISVGEPLNREVAEAFYKLLPAKAVIVNILGQTETTGMVAAYAVPRRTENLPAVIPCGKPAAGIEVVILNEQLQPVEQGCEGELCISAGTVSPGYYNNPEADSLKFMSLHSQGSEQRVYRTGDHGLINKEGIIELRGRQDFQLKISGNRIEAGEVEAELMRCGINDAVVLAGNKDGENILCAVVVNNGAVIQVNGLKKQLLKRLPPFMVPERIFSIAALPLTATGKTDRAALAVMISDKLTRHTGFTTRFSDTLSRFLPVYKETELSLLPFIGMDDTLFILFQSPDILFTTIVNRLLHTGNSVVVTGNSEDCALPGVTYIKNSKQRENKFIRLKEEITVSGCKKVSVLFFSSYNGNTQSSKELTESIYNSLNNFVLLFQMLNDVLPEKQLSVAVIDSVPATEHPQMIDSVSAENSASGINSTHYPFTVNPIAKMLSGFLKTVAVEYPGLSTATVSVPQPLTPEFSDSTIDTLIRDCTEKLQHREICYSGNTRYLRAYTTAGNSNADKSNSTEITLKQGGTYLITGGTGYIGLVTAKFLLEQTHGNIILLSRNGINPDLFVKVFGCPFLEDSAGEKPQMCSVAGGRLFVYSADISDKEEVSNLAGFIQTHFTGVNGLIHSAGIRNNFTRISLMNDEQIRAEIKTKIEGTLNVIELGKLFSPDFVWLYSSMSSVLGRFEQATYCAGNSFVDSFADMVLPFPLTVFNWDTWEEPFAVAPAKQNTFVKPITAEQGCEVMQQILTSPHRRVLVSFRPMDNEAGVFVHGELTELKEKREGYVAAETTLEADLTMIWEECLQTTGIGVTDNFFLLGGTSFIAMKIFALINRKYNSKFPFSGIADAQTIRTQASALKSHSVAVSKTPVLCIKKGSNGQVPVFCVSSGVTAFHFYSLAAFLPEDRPVFALQALPGMDRITLEERADIYIEAVRNVYGGSEFILCGESFGGIIAFEMARRLSEAGDKIKLLALFDTNADQLKNYFRHLGLINAALKKSGRSIFRMYRVVDFHLASLRRTTNEGGGNFRLQKRLADQINIPEIVFSNRKQKDTYIPGVFSGDAVLFKARDQSLRSIDRKYYGWETLVKGKLSVVSVPGDHIGIFRFPFVKVLSTRLQECIAATDKQNDNADSEFSLSEKNE